MTERVRFGIREGQVTILGEIMTLKGAGLLLALALATGTGAAALPLSHADGLSDGTSLAQQVRHHYRWHHWHGHWRGCPYWYERTFWGAYRLHSPCSNRLTEHAY
jgi:hypothetical protein